MGKIGLIIRREYFTRVKNKTFIIMCLLGPLLWAALIIVPSMLAGRPGAPRTIVVVDKSGLSEIDPSLDYARIFRDTMNLHFNYTYVGDELDAVRRKFKDSTHTSVLYIPENFLGGADSTAERSWGKTVKLFSKNEPGHNTLSYLGAQLSQEYRRMLLQLDSIPIDVIEKTKETISVVNDVNDKVSKAEVKAVVGFIFAFVIYLYIFIYGVQVMRGVIEEKTTRIVEVIVSSVRPFQLMMGKIIGIMLVGLTQFFLWIALSFLIITPIINSINKDRLDYTKAQPPGAITQVMPEQEKTMLDFSVGDETKDTIATIMSIPWGNLLVSFFFYFILGYLLYGAMFAAVGSAVDSESDTQQFMLPVTIPLIIAIAMSSTVMADPDGPIAQWLSYIPFTSPVAMMIRIPFSDPTSGASGGVHVVDILLSLGILFATFLFMTWLAGKIYRTGILMYGKKTTWKELGKWLFYRG